MSNEPMTSDESTELDALIGEYQTPQAPAKDPEISELVGFVRETKQNQEQEQTNQALSEAVAFIKEDEANAVHSDRVIRGYMREMATEDEGINTAFQQRATNPAGWKAVQESLKTGFATDMASVKGDPTKDDVAAAMASVRGMSSTIPEPVSDLPSNKDMTTMNDYDFKLLMEERAAKSG